MRSYTFHWEIRDIIAQFSNAFNYIVIKRHNIDKEPEDQIHVNFMYAPKTRTLHEIVQKNQHFKMPVVSVWNGGFRRAPERVFSKIKDPIGLIQNHQQHLLGFICCNQFRLI